MEKLTTPAARIAEFVRQAMLLSNIDRNNLYSVHTDPNSDGATLSLHDLTELLTSAAPETAADELEQLQERIVSSIRGRDGEAGAGNDAYVGGGLSQVFGPGYDYLEINGNLDVQHLASDLLQDGYGQNMPNLHDVWEAGADAMVSYLDRQHLGIDAPANPYSAYKD